jgi:SAM-dependent methyltransferase
VSLQPHLPLVQACEELFLEHGDTYRGQGWTKSQENTDTRYGVMLDLLGGSNDSVSLLDFGCGTGHLLEYIERRGIGFIEYSGLDVSDRFVHVARTKFPNVRFYLGDLVHGGVELPMFDYIVMNGLFTYKGPLSFDDAATQWQRLITTVMAHARVGVAFNTTSPYVDWQRDDLFHVPIQMLADVVAASACPHFRIRHDYGLFESTVYAYRSPNI